MPRNGAPTRCAIRELQEDVDDAELANDFARAERAQAELDALVDH